MGVRVLADKKRKLTILTTAPADEANPTVTELNAGIEACLKVAEEGFVHSATDSTKVDFKAVCGDREQVFTDSNFQLSLSVVREYLAEGGVDPTGDALFAALNQRGVTFWAYGRMTDKPALDPWEAGDECYLGTRATTDNYQTPTAPGWIMFNIPCTVQAGWQPITVAAGA